MRSSSPLDHVRLSLGPTYKDTPYAVAGIGTPSDSEPRPRFATEVIIADPDLLGVTYETDSVSVQGFAAPHDLWFHPAHPATTAGFLIAKRLHVTRVTGARADVEPWLGTEVEPLASLSSSAACSDLSLDAPGELRALAPTAPRAARRSALRLGAVALSLEPGGPVVARLNANDLSADAKIIEERGHAVRIVWDVPGAIVFGWVAREALLGATGRGYGYGHSGDLRPAAVASVRCDRDVPLGVAVGVLRVVVGVVRAGVTIEVVERADAADRINPPRGPHAAFADVDPVDGAAFWVDDRDVQACSAAPPRPKAE